jgi:hypothetical protein
MGEPHLITGRHLKAKGSPVIPATSEAQTGKIEAQSQPKDQGPGSLGEKHKTLPENNESEKG